MANVGELVGELAELACPDCGIKFMEFRAGGRLGCPHDYGVFATRTAAACCSGTTARPGTSARWPGGAQAPSERLRLRTRLREAIAREDYEEAARLRDLLRLKDRRRMNLDDLTKSSGEWLRGTGPESDIVMCSRIRLARNLADFPFTNRASRGEKAEIEAHVQRGHRRTPSSSSPTSTSTACRTLDRQFLVERQLISRELANGEGPRGVAIGPQENVAIMVNEEDHLRIQVMLSGLSLHDVWDADQPARRPARGAARLRLQPAARLPDRLPDQRRHRHPRRRDAPPARPWSRPSRSTRSSAPSRRSTWPSAASTARGRQAFGDFYQISNQQTLGKSEPELIRILTDVVPQVIQYERTARQALLTERRQHLHDQVSRAYGVLKTAQTISSEETMLLLSSVRMGINLGLIDDLAIATVNELFIQTQPAYLQKLRRVRARRRGAERRPGLVPAEPAVQRPAGAPPLRPSASADRDPRIVEPAPSDPRRTTTRVAVQLRDRPAQGAGRHARSATLQEIRDAYRQKAKRYHPDAGGEDWAFRILVQAYEMLSSARVARAARVETRRPAARRAACPGREPSSRDRPRGHPRQRRRPVAHRRRRAPLRPLSLGRRRATSGSARRVPDEERFLSCSLNISWPDAGAARSGADDPATGGDRRDAAARSSTT